MASAPAPVAPQTPRPRFDSYHLPLPRGRWGPGAALSLLLHGLGVAVLVWRGAELVASGGGGAGPLGGGGGGGRQAARFFSLPSVAPPAVAAVAPAPPVVVETPAPQPAPVPMPPEPIEPPQPADQSVPTGAEPGVVGAAGAGPGTGGGQGTGAGPGVGAQAGPGTGGEAGYIFPANPRWAIVPPMNRPESVRGRRYRVQFWVGADGRVTRVAVAPEIKDGGYRREFIERMMGYVFTPAMTRAGERIASLYSITLTL